MVRFSHKNSRRRKSANTKKSRRGLPKRGGAYYLDFTQAPVGGMAPVVAYNDYVFEGGKRHSRKKKSGRKSLKRVPSRKSLTKK